MLVVILLSFIHNPIMACDGCGCSISNLQSIGSLAYRGNGIGIHYNRVTFKGNPDHNHNSTDYFHTLRVNGSYYFNERLHITGQIPYKWNIRKDDVGQIQQHAFGDVKVQVNYSILESTELAESIHLFWDAGLGLMMPTGKYDPDIHDKNLPENFNTGIGSWSALFQTNALISKKNMGLSLGGNYQVNSKTHTSYHFGNQWNGQLLFYYDHSFSEQSRILPSIGLLSEWIEKDNFANHNQVPETGGNGHFVVLGLNYKLQNYMIGINGALPFSQQYSDHAVRLTSRWELQFNILFNNSF